MHIPILLKEVVESLNIKEGDTVVDCTTNRGGHSISIAKKIGSSGRLICIDLDNTALSQAKTFLDKELKINKPTIFYINDNFKNTESILENLNIKKVDAIFTDLGVSSEELDESGRGFTFQKEEPLLMTLKDKVLEDDLTAEKILNTWQEETLADIIYYYSDEKYAKRIAKNICEFRKKKNITTTFDLVNIISSSVPEKYKHGKTHFATKTFQAIRIAVNDELKSEEILLNSLIDILKEDGRAGFLTFHSGEDRVLKNNVKNKKGKLRLIKFDNKKDFKEPSIIEIKNNPRARSAKLRIIEKIKN